MRIKDVSLGLRLRQLLEELKLIQLIAVVLFAVERVKFDILSEKLHGRHWAFVDFFGDMMNYMNVEWQLYHWQVEKTTFLIAF